MATVTNTPTAADIVAGAASTIAALDQRVAVVVADVTAAKNKVVSALQAHVDAHNADIAKHQAEVTAATALIAQASPATTVKADTAAAYVLTSSSQVQGVVNFLGRNWRYVVGVAAVGIVVFGKFVLHI
jgi:hypothetical protein